jgi:hypothetical protein
MRCSYHGGNCRSVGWAETVETSCIPGTERPLCVRLRSQRTISISCDTLGPCPCGDMLEGILCRSVANLINESHELCIVDCSIYSLRRAGTAGWRVLAVMRVCETRYSHRCSMRWET